jgi:glucans biosynthesis protein
VAYWVPSTPVQALKPIRFNYLLHAYAYSAKWPPGGRAVATRTGDAAVGGYSAGGEGKRRILVDFAGGDLAGLHQTQPVRVNVTAKGGAVDDVTIQRLPDSTGTWRASFRVAPKRDEIELRCYLTLYGEALTETWTYQWMR